MLKFPNFRHLVRLLSTKTGQKCAQVCILGADTPIGQSTSFLLKQNPLISVLHLQGTSRVEAIGIDLSHFDTQCRVQTYYDMNSVSKSMKSADVVLMLGLDTSTSKKALNQLVMAEGQRVCKLAESCSKYAPKALLVVAVNPVSVMVPMVAEVFKKSHWYHPARLLGSVALAQIKANALSGHSQNLDPQAVHVPLVGGPDLDCALPIFTQSTPIGMARKDADRLYKLFKEEIPNPIASQAFALNRMVTSLCAGICGDENAVVSAFIRSNIINTCRHMVCAVKIGKVGVVHNYGLQKLTKAELAEFEKITLVLRDREAMAYDFVNRPDKCKLPEFMLKEIEQEKTAKLGIIR